METGTLKINRARYFNDKMSGKGFSIFIDGKEEGKAAYNEPKSFQLPVGEHIVFAKVNWGKSREMMVNIKANETFEVELGMTAPPTKGRFIIAILFVIIYFGARILGRYLENEMIKDIAFYSLLFYGTYSLLVYRKKSALYTISFGHNDFLYLKELSSH